MAVQKYSVIKNGEIVNTILLDPTSDYTPPEGHTLEVLTTPNKGIGWKKIDGVWKTPHPPEGTPSNVEDPEISAAKANAKAELKGKGFTDATAALIVDGSPAE